MSSKILESVIQKRSEEFVSPENELQYDDEELDDDNDDAHNKLITNISSLESHNNTKKSIKWKVSRREATKDVSEYNLINNNERKKLRISDLIKSAKDETGHLKRQLRRLEKRKILKKPLEKPVSDLIKRKVNYDLICKDISKWDGTVIKNRNAEQLTFPIKSVSLRLKPAHEITKRFVPKTKLEIEVSKILKNSDNVLNDEKILTKAEERYLKALSLDEAKSRLKELQKMRALMSFQEAKLKRQSKIKSKRYHRILKKEKIKKQMTEFEAIKKINPDAALDKFNELDKLRALERASLKHRNTGKWSKHHKLRVKYDDNARREIAEQLELSKKLMKKVVINESESDDDDDHHQHHQRVTNETVINDDEQKLNEEIIPEDYNPWMRMSNVNVKINDKSESIQNDESLKTNIKMTLKMKRKRLNDDSVKSNKTVKKSINNENEDLSVSERMGNDVPLIDETYGNNNEEIHNDINQNELNNNRIDDVQINPNDFLTLKSKKNKTFFPNMSVINSEGIDDDGDDIINVIDADDDDDDDDNQRKIIAEAFADDDVVNDFDAEKRAVIENEKGKDISLYLPGWGCWGGNGIRENKRKIRKFTVKAKNKIRKDNSIGNVIISEKKDEIISKFKVRELPFPFKNVVQFENSIRQPIGNTWNPETAFRNLIEPKIITKMGTIIEPIDSDSLVNTKPVQRVFKKNEKSKKSSVNKDN